MTRDEWIDKAVRLAQFAACSPGTEIYADLRAHLATQPSEWMPIDTVKRDESDVVAWHPLHGAAVTFFGSGEHETDGYTHWQPLPQPPKEPTK